MTNPLPCFEFASAGRIVFGSGSLDQIGVIGRDWGPRVLVVTGSRADRASILLSHVENAGFCPVVLSVPGEPTLDWVQEAVVVSKSEKCDWVIGFGGGSAVDAGKAVAIMHTQDGELLDYVEVIGNGRALSHPGLPYVAIPTTAGTGAEVTKNAVLGSKEHGVKVSLRSPLMLPRVALVDPQLTLSLPFEVTASTGLDALTQLLEAYVCTRAQPMTDALAEQGIRLASVALERTCLQPDDLAARESMSLAALYSGIALANAGLGAVHGFAAPIGGMFAAPHGAVCATLLPHVWRSNRETVQLSGTPAQRERFAQVSRWLTRQSDAAPEDAEVWLSDLVAKLRIPNLSTYGVTSNDVPEIVRRAQQASSMKANPIALGREALESLLLRALA